MSEAIVGLVGVIIGAFIAAAKDIVSHVFRRRNNARYLAIRVVCVLEEYIVKCAEVVADDGTSYGQMARTNDGQEYRQAQIPLPPAPTYPDDVDWQSVDADRMYKLLELPNLVRDAERYVSESADHAHFPDYDALFDARVESHLQLGLKAADLAEGLRKSYRLPEKSSNEWGTGWDPKKYLKDKQLEFLAKREA